MAQINLDEEEYIISSDEVSCKDNFFSRKGTLYLTNARLLFLDIGSWGKKNSFSVPLEDIDLLEPQKNGFMIDTEKGKHSYKKQ